MEGISEHIEQKLEQVFLAAKDDILKFSSSKFDVESDSVILSEVRLIPFLSGFY